MEIWFALLIPFATAAIMLMFFSRKVTWWEVLLPLGASFLLILIAKCLIEYTQCCDTEYWTGWVTHAEYHEKWTEEWDEYVSESSHTDSKGRTVVDTPAHTVHHVDHHPPQWNMFGSNGEDYSIDSSTYDRLVQLWKCNTKEKLYHSNQTSWGDGNMYHTNWNNSRDTMIVCTSAHTYQNRVIASKSVFKFQDISKKEAEELGLFDYPATTDPTTVPSILGSGGPTMASANKLLCVRNAELGHRKQVRMWVLIFNSADQQLGLDQESYWAGGNKNEFVLCIGVDNGHVKWAYPFSWCEDEQLKIDVRQAAVAQDVLDLDKIVTSLADNVEKRFARKHFKEFNYLSVEPPFWALMTTFIVTLIANIGICVWAVVNEFDPDDADTTNRLHKAMRRWKNL